MFFFPSIIYVVILLTSFIHFIYSLSVSYAPDIAVIAEDAKMIQTQPSL